MPARDEQEFERRRQQIMDGALEVFAAKGYERATNKDIARAAGIASPGLIYHYFADKADLFRSALERHSPALALLSRTDSLMDLPPREVLTTLGRGFLAITESGTAVAVAKVMLSEATRRPVVAEIFNAFGPRRGIDFLTRYLSRQMDAGAMRRMDPGAAARCFVGPLIAYLLTRVVFPQADTRTLEAETMVQTAVDVFLRGMAAEGA
jgi:TetR/AcrR family transcriptional regulator, mexJK operon transcriptional repressor